LSDVVSAASAKADKEHTSRVSRIILTGCFIGFTFLVYIFDDWYEFRLKDSVFPGLKQGFIFVHPIFWDKKRVKIKQLDFIRLIFLNCLTIVKAVKRSSNCFGLSREPVGGVNR